MIEIRKVRSENFERKVLSDKATAMHMNMLPLPPYNGVVIFHHHGHYHCHQFHQPDGI